MRVQRKELSEKISEISADSKNEEDIANRAMLKEKLKFNPKYYANDYNLLPHPIILELLHMVYVKGGKTAIFFLYLILDLCTNVCLLQAYKTMRKKPDIITSFLLICMNPLSIASV